MSAGYIMLCFTRIIEVNMLCICFMLQKLYNIDIKYEIAHHLVRKLGFIAENVIANKRK